MEPYSVLQTVYMSDDPAAFKISLESMINQTVKPNEIVLVKDGPISGLLQEVIDELDAKFPGIIRQISLEKNVGLGLALNEGLRYCKNELIARMDSDDISLPTRCEKQLEMFVRDPALDIVGSQVDEFVGTPENVVGKRNVPLEHDSIRRYAKRRDPFNHPTVMYRKSKVERCGPYRDYRKNQDTALWIDMLGAGCKAANSSEVLLNFRFDENTYKKRKGWSNTKLLIEIRYNAWRRGFCSLGDYLLVAALQIGIYVMPVSFQKFIYTKLLR